MKDKLVFADDKKKTVHHLELFNIINFIYGAFKTVWLFVVPCTKKKYC